MHVQQRYSSAPQTAINELYQQTITKTLQYIRQNVFANQHSGWDEDMIEHKLQLLESMWRQELQYVPRIQPPPLRQPYRRPTFPQIGYAPGRTPGVISSGGPPPLENAERPTYVKQETDGSVQVKQEEVIVKREASSPPLPSDFYSSTPPGSFSSYSSGNAGNNNPYPHSSYYPSSSPYSSSFPAYSSASSSSPSLTPYPSSSPSYSSSNSSTAASVRHNSGPPSTSATSSSSTTTSTSARSLPPIAKELPKQAASTKGGKGGKAPKEPKPAKEPKATGASKRKRKETKSEAKKADLGSDEDEEEDDLALPNQEEEDQFEDDELGSGDDDPDDRLPPIYHKVICQFVKRSVIRRKARWLCTLTNGLASINGIDYCFKNADGDFQWN